MIKNGRFLDMTKFQQLKQLWSCTIKMNKKTQGKKEQLTNKQKNSTTPAYSININHLNISYIRREQDFLNHFIVLWWLSKCSSKFSLVFHPGKDWLYLDDVMKFSLLRHPAQWPSGFSLARNSPCYTEQAHKSISSSRLK